MELSEYQNLTGPVIIIGHYGSGKTEFSVNLCSRLAGSGHFPVLADLDIVNPYFRSREMKKYFAECGIRVISSNLDSEEDYHQDVPAIAAEIRTCFETADRLSIIDVGGDAVGANVLSQYAPLLSGRSYQMWLTVNANRPFTSNPEDVIQILEQIETAARLKVTGLINTTHMLDETEAGDIYKGEHLVRELSVRLDLPVICTAVLEEAVAKVQEEKLSAPVFPIKRFMKLNW